MFLIGCARGSCARGYNVCDMHAQIMQQSAAVRKQQQHVEFALRDKHVVSDAGACKLLATEIRRVHQVECACMRMLQICVACVYAHMMARWQCHS